MRYGMGPSLGTNTFRQYGNGVNGRTANARGIIRVGTDANTVTSNTITVPLTALVLNGQAILLNGQYITLGA